MKMVCFLVLACMFWRAAPAAMAAEGPGELPAPLRESGLSALAALEQRASAPQQGFPAGELSREETATLLWAAAGRNRAGAGWTAPTALGRDPYVTVYVATAQGAARYDGAAHTLEAVSPEDIRAGVSSQSFAASAPTVFIFVMDTGKTGAFGTPERGAAFGQVLTGAMTQNMYLAAAALNVGVRYMATFDEAFLRAKLGLRDADVPVCILPAGAYR